MTGLAQDTKDATENILRIPFLLIIFVQLMETDGGFSRDF